MRKSLDKSNFQSKKLPTYTIFLAFIIALITLADQYLFFRESSNVWDPNKINQDPTTLWAERLQNIKSDLPDKGVVGYLSEMDYPGLSYNIIDSDEEFVMTQYNLAPLILDRGNPNHQLVIANIVGDGPFDFEGVFGLRVINNYGYGIYLLEPIS
jgi:hypothetical protein